VVLGVRLEVADYRSYGVGGRRRFRSEAEAVPIEVEIEFMIAAQPAEGEELPPGLRAADGSANVRFLIVVMAVFAGIRRA
jgi:hypothetical protein